MSPCTHVDYMHNRDAWMQEGWAVFLAACLAGGFNPTQRDSMEETVHDADMLPPAPLSAMDYARAHEFSLSHPQEYADVDPYERYYPDRTEEYKNVRPKVRTCTGTPARPGALASQPPVE